MGYSYPQFVQFNTKDGLTLPGLIYEPNKKTKAAAIYLHGNGSSSVFYNETDNRPLADALGKIGVTTLYFNNRGAHFIKRLRVKKGTKVERKYFGMAYEKIKECVPDIDGAISFLKKRGYRKFYLIGASTGANKICAYNFYKPKNEIKGYVLVCGGDDLGFYYHMLGKSKFWKLLRESKRKISQKKGKEIITEMLPNNVFSYAAFYDTANPDGNYNVFPFYEAIHKLKLSKKPLFRHFRSINKPTLSVYGSDDEYVWGSAQRVVDILKSYQPKIDYKIIKGADHRFSRHGRDLAKAIADWLKEN